MGEYMGSSHLALQRVTLTTPCGPNFS